MGLIELASGNSVWRGMDYYNAKKTKSVEKTGPYTYDGTVQGEQLYLEALIEEEERRNRYC